MKNSKNKQTKRNAKEERNRSEGKKKKIKEITRFGVFGCTVEV